MRRLWAATSLPISIVSVLALNGFALKVVTANPTVVEFEWERNDTKNKGVVVAFVYQAILVVCFHSGRGSVTVINTHGKSTNNVPITNQPGVMHNGR